MVGSLIYRESENTGGKRPQSEEEQVLVLKISLNSVLRERLASLHIQFSMTIHESAWPLFICRLLSR
jgi:hypothetical protein